MSSALRSQVQSGRCVLLHLGASWSPESKIAADKIRAKGLKNVTVQFNNINDVEWNHVQFPSVPTFRIWAQNEYIMETTSWERAVEKCEMIAHNPLTSAMEKLHSGDLDGAYKSFQESLLIGHENKCKALLGILQVHLHRTEKSYEEMESIIQDLRSHHEAELRPENLITILQGELQVYAQKECCTPLQKEAIILYMDVIEKKINKNINEEELLNQLDITLKKAVEDYHLNSRKNVIEQSREYPDDLTRTGVPDVLNLSLRVNEPDDIVLSKLITCVWVIDRTIAEHALFYIEQGFLQTNNPVEAFQLQEWKSWIPRIIRHRRGGRPEILKNRKWNWLGPDWCIVNNKKVNSGYA